MFTRDKILGVILISLSLVSTLFTYTLFNYVRHVTLQTQFTLPRARKVHQVLDSNSYSYIGDDFPLMLPGVLDKTVKMVAEESVHFSLSSTPEAKAVWYAAFYDGDGSVNLGPHHRTFFVSMYHEIHCLQQFRDTLAERKSFAWGHLHHCLNYMRERALCQADMTLEPGDFRARNFAEDRVGATHICRDWNAVISVVDANWNDWVSVWKEFHNVTQ
ncbi:hypothetical protein C8J57DRAFT_1217019 [Mycena rebaudengoi]|nr:hypothetical protein C8J57DRAFT_1217019 [Mycena rebaudengoi]